MDKISIMNRSIARFHALQIRRKSLEKFVQSDTADKKDVENGLEEIKLINGECFALVNCMRSDLSNHPEIRLTLMNNPRDISKDLFDVLFHTEDLRVEKRMGQNQRNFRRAS